MVQKCIMGSSGGGGNAKTIYGIMQGYLSGGYRWVVFDSANEDYYMSTDSYGAGISVDDDNITMTKTANDQFSITFKKSGTITNSTSKTTNHYNVGQSYTLNYNNGATLPLIIVMD